MGPIGQMISKAGPLGAAIMGNDNPFSKIFKPDPVTPGQGPLALSTAVAKTNQGRGQSVQKFQSAATKAFPEIMGGGDTSADASPFAGLRTVGPHIGKASVPSPAERPTPDMTLSAAPVIPQPQAMAPQAAVVSPAAYTPPSGNPGASPTGPLPETTPKGSAGSYAYNRLMKVHGLNPHAAAGIVGNLAQESGFADDVLTGRRRGDNGASAYAAQWQGPRLRNLEAFAKERGHATPSFDDQIDFTVEEGKRGLDAGAAKALRLLQNARSPEEAADIFRDHFERPSADDRGSRRAHARKWAAQRGDPNWAPPPSLSGAGGPSSGGDTTPLEVGVPQEPWEMVLEQYKKPAVPEVSVQDAGTPSPSPAATNQVATAEQAKASQPQPLDAIIEQISKEKSTRALASLDRKNQIAALMRAGQLERQRRDNNA